MGRTPCCLKEGLNRGPWTPAEDSLLINYIQAHGEGQWRSLPKKAGLLRCGKSCRLRWMNYLRPDIKRGDIRPDEEDLIIRLHSLLGNRWSLIAKRLPGRTDNEIKNYWNTRLHKKLNQPRNRFDQDSKLPRTSFDPQKGTATATKTMVHIPKPVRVSSLGRTESSNSALSAHEAKAIDEYLKLLQAEDCIQLKSYDSLLT